MKKRGDLQGVRGLAVSAVVLFHFFPGYFPNGFIGVDQFFVLSGFLMHFILSKNTTFNFSILMDFYYRRMKRILPLYLLIILTTMIVFSQFNKDMVEENSEYAVKSLLLTSNFVGLGGDDEADGYAKMLNEAVNFFTHTWSLSAEVQFYVIAPILIVPSIFVSQVMFSLCLGIIAIFSFIAFFYIDGVLGLEELAFNCMFTRIWQFSFGIYASYMTVSYAKGQESFDTESLLGEKRGHFVKTRESTILFYILLLTTVLFAFYPMAIGKSLIRPLVTIQTATLIFVGGRFPYTFLSSRLLTYLGDISYSLYLVHWPVYVFMKTEKLESVPELLLGILACLIVSIIITETYEKFYLRQEKSLIVFLCCILYFGNTLILYDTGVFETENEVYTTEFHDIYTNVSIDLAIAMNRGSSKNDIRNLIVGACRYSATHGFRAPYGTCDINRNLLKGNLSLMVIGNSFSPNVLRMFARVDECRKKAKTWTVFSRPACEVLEDGSFSNNPSIVERCTGMPEIFLNVTESVKPDVLFIIARYLTAMVPTSKDGPDLIYQEEVKNIKALEKLVKYKIFILNALPRNLGHITRLVNNELVNGRRIEQSEIMDKSANYKIARDRLEKLEKECPKCQLFDVMGTLENNGEFEFYDKKTGLQFFTSYMHFSDFGLQKIKPVFRNICNSI